MQRRPRTSEAFVAGVAAMTVATAVLGLVHLVQASFPFPPLGLAQRLLRLVPGPVAVFFIDLLGHWALRLFAVGFTVGSILAGGGAAVLVARTAGPGAHVAEDGSPRRTAPSRPARAAWLAAGALGLAALAGYRVQPGAPSLLVYGVVVAVAAAVYASFLLGALGRLERDPVPAPASGLGRTRRELLRAVVGAAGLLATGFAIRRLTGGIGDSGGQPLARPAGAAPVRPAPAPAAGDDQATWAIAGLTPEVTSNRLHYTVDESIIDPNVDSGSWRLRVAG
ncbi:MAG TPA: hypothetical protein VFO47_02550, partial [Actinomycetes bacterium]|nr:hypothetical protein [Actinomycetes bacterium]